MTLAEMGPLVNEAVIDLLGKIGILEKDFGSRFSEVAKVLIGDLHAIGKKILCKTLVRVCDEYSFPVNLSEEDPLQEKFVFLQDRVLSDHMTPRHAQRALREAHYMAPRYVSVFDSFSINPQTQSSSFRQR